MMKNRTEDAEKWRPIGSAPKDGTNILIWPVRFKRNGIKFDIGKCYWHQPANKNAKGMWVGTGRIEYPTHWMPLPAPPTT